MPVAGPNLRIIDPSAGQTCATTTSVGGAPPTERALDWNTAGPAGPAGPTGPTGQTGSQGGTTTVAQGHTFTTAGGQVITVGSSPGITLAPPAIHGAIGEVVIGSGKSALTFDIVGLGLVNPGTSAQTGSGGGAGKVAIHDISITKTVDKASPTLSLFCANGKHIPKVTIALRHAGKVYLTYHLDNVLISSYQTGGHGIGGAPVESLTLNFAKLALQDSK